MDIPEAALQHLTAFAGRFARWIQARRSKKRQRGEPGAYVLGLTGGQGTGKTTLRCLLEQKLAELGLREAGFSLDDIYKTHAGREQLRRECSYFRFRGVYGTHDVDLGEQVLYQLKHGGDHAVAIPRFDKSLHGGAGDRLPQNQWRSFTGTADVVILEGWCVGGRQQSAAQLAKPVCDIERSPEYDDTAGSFRRRINAELAGYAGLFGELDDLAVLQIPGIEAIYRWRVQQERDLLAETGSGMDAGTVRSFVDYFIPSTIRYIMPLGVDPAQGASLVLLLDADHRISRVREFAPANPRELPVEEWLDD
jgi:D-glycerate 3-kinase